MIFFQSLKRYSYLFLLILIVLLNLHAVADAQGTGYWHTSGDAIFDANGNTVRIAGINWSGFETTDEVAHGLWAEDYKSILRTIKNNGYNTIRVPFSNQMVETPIVPSNIGYTNSQSGATATLYNASWNTRLAAGSTLAGVGFLGSYSGSNAAPSVFFVNGTRCQ